MLFIYFFFVNRYNMFKYCYFMAHGQTEKYDVLAYTKKKFGKLAFSDHNLITSHQPAVILICIDPLGHWKYAQSYHHSKLSLLIEYDNSRAAGVYSPECLLIVYLVRVDEGEGR